MIQLRFQDLIPLMRRDAIVSLEFLNIHVRHEGGARPAACNENVVLCAAACRDVAGMPPAEVLQSVRKSMLHIQRGEMPSQRSQSEARRDVRKRTTTNLPGHGHAELMYGAAGFVSPTLAAPALGATCPTVRLVLATSKFQNNVVTHKAKARMHTEGQLPIGIPIGTYDDR